MYKNKTIGVVVPAYNEEMFVGEVVQTMPAFVDRIYVVNDASTDDTAKVLARICEKRLKVISHDKRGGAGSAMLSGYRIACEECTDIVAIMAGDGQMDPAILHKFIDPLLENQADYSKGDRLSGQGNSQGMPALRLFGNRLLTFIIKIASGYWHISDPLNGYTAITRETLVNLDLNKIERGYAFETNLLIKLGTINARVVNVGMPARYRNEKSKISYLNFTVYTSWVIFRDCVCRLLKKFPRFRIARLYGEEKESC